MVPAFITAEFFRRHIVKGRAPFRAVKIPVSVSPSLQHVNVLRSQLAT